MRPTGCRLLAFALAAMLSGCSGERTLPNGYKWLSIYGDSGVITDRHSSLIVDMKVSSATLRVSGQKVYGLREVEKPVGNPPTRTSPIAGRYGEFVLNTTTGSIDFLPPAPGSKVRNGS